MAGSSRVGGAGGSDGPDEPGDTPTPRSGEPGKRSGSVPIDRAGSTPTNRSRVNRSGPAGSVRRERELARQRRERQQARRIAARERARRRQALLGAGLAVLLVVAAVAFLAFRGHDKSVPSAGGTPTSTAASSATPTASTTAAAAAGPCRYPAEGSAARNVGLPPATPVTTGSSTATLTTNRGVIRISLLRAQAPCTANALRYLAAKKYFDNTPCHRLTTGAGLKVLQCGDPTGSGSGGPGFTLPDENLKGATYRAGTVAMANTGQPGTGGSQFFLVYADSTLPPQYTPFGRITAGLDVLTAVAKAGTPGGDGKPTLPVQIRTLRVT